MDADYIEIDLQLTKDGHLICMHNSTVDATTDGKGKIKDMTLSEIKELNIKGGHKVPSLEEVLDHFGRDVNYYIETKRPQEEEMDLELIRLLEERSLIGVQAYYGQVVIQSFSEESLKNIHKYHASTPKVKLTSSAQLDELDAIEKYAIGAGPKFGALTKEFVEEAKKRDLYVHPYTVNSRKDIEKALELGVDGFFTNYPDRGRDEVSKKFDIYG